MLLQLEMGLTKSISDLVALVCQKTGLYPTDFYGALHGHRLMPDSSLQQCCLPGGHALYHQLRQGLASQVSSRWQQQQGLPLQLFLARQGGLCR
jgi:hypothetical protein